MALTDDLWNHIILNRLDDILDRLWRPTQPLIQWVPVTFSTRGVRPKVVLDAMKKTNISFYCRESKPDCWVVQALT